MLREISHWTYSWLPLNQALGVCRQPAHLGHNRAHVLSFKSCTASVQNLRSLHRHPGCQQRVLTFRVRAAPSLRGSGVLCK